MAAQVIFKFGKELVKGAQVVIKNGKKANQYYDGKVRVYTKSDGRGKYISIPNLKKIFRENEKAQGTLTANEIGGKVFGYRKRITTPSGKSMQGVKDDGGNLARQIFKNAGIDMSQSARLERAAKAGKLVAFKNSPSKVADSIDITRFNLIKKFQKDNPTIAANSAVVPIQKLLKQKNLDTVDSNMVNQVYKELDVLGPGPAAKKEIKTAKLKKMAEYIENNLGQISPVVKSNYPFLAKMMEEFNISSPESMKGYITALNQASKGVGTKRGITFSKESQRAVRLLPSIRNTQDVISLAKFSPKNVKLENDITSAIRSISNTKNAFEHKLPKFLVGKYLPRSYLIKGEHTTAALNRFKSWYDARLANYVAKRERAIKGIIDPETGMPTKYSATAFSSDVDKARKIISDLTGYKPGYIRMADDGTVTAFNASRRYIDKINDVGPRAAGIFQFMKNQKHSNKLHENLLKWRDGKLDKKYDSVFQSFEKDMGRDNVSNFVSDGFDQGIDDAYNALAKKTFNQENVMDFYIQNPDNIFFQALGKGRRATKGYKEGTDSAFLEELLKGYEEGGRVDMEDGGRVEYGQGTGPAGVQPIANPKTDFDTVVRQMQDTTGLGLGDAVLEVMKDRAMAVPLKDRNNYSGGGSVTKGGQFGLDVTNKVGAVESLLAGIASGLIDIPKGAFTLGASLLDLGFGTNNAAKVSSFFDDLTTFDEKAKDHFLGEFAKVAVNLGVPGYYGFKAGEKLARTALLAKRNGNYFKLTDPKLVEKFNTSLNAGGRLMATLGGAAGAGVTDAIFVGDPEGVGTFGDMVGGGPTELDPNDEKIASREILNRVKFGVDGSLFLGLIGGAGSSIKSLYRRRNDLASNNDAIDKFLGAFRPRGQKSQEYFDLERRNIGVRATDINFASQEARKLDKHIDAIFPFVKNPFNKMGNEGRSKFMDKLNETLLSGESTMNAIGKVEFGPMDRALKEEVESIMRSRGAAKADIEGVFDSFEAIRGRWGRMFSRLGTTMDDEVRDGFAPLFSKKFKDYLGSTYEMFQNKSLIPLFRYKPTEESLDKVIKIFQDSAEDAGKPITKEQAEFYANQVVETAKLPRDLATASERTSGIYFDAPDFFVNRTTLSELEGRGTVALEDVINSDKKAFEELFGKVKDPMQTMLTGTNRLSLIARRNQFFNELLGSDKKMAAERAKFLTENPGGVTPATMRGFFRETEREAVEAFGQNIKKIDIDPSRTIEAGITNPLHGKYAEKGVAEAIEESSMLARDKSTLQQLYDSFVLYPKATSQMAKTILSPVTHIRNFVSAGAFASSNGLFLQAPDEIAAAMKDAYKALQIPGSRMANDEYRKLLSLGVVNSNVRLGDLQKLLKDTNFGETINSTKAMRNLMRPLSKLKKWTEDMYTAEDDFWKITSYALERRQLANAYKKYGINKTIDELDEEAADLIRNQIPNYDMVNDFIRATRKLPLGNFVSFPAEIMRTTANILNRAIKEINMTHTLDDGRIVKPLQGIGYKRLFGLGTTVVAIPYGTVEAAKAIYGVTEDEMQAMRRFVPDWSKNSTLVPIRGEDGDLKYIDFSHANAYDTMIRPITAMYTGLQRGMDENAIGREVLKGMWEGTKETLSPFVSESIWTSAISDIFIRGGRTREGNRLWTDETPWGEMMSKAIMHAAETQFPGSLQTFKRLDLAIEPVDILTKGKFDKYGQTFELGDELLGFAGMRAVEVNPLRAMDFKIADFRTGINNARREFTGPTLRGPVDPGTIVDRYKVASEALYKVQEKMHRDYLAARTLGTPVTSLDLKFGDRISDVQLQAIKRGVFKPFIPSENIEKAFADNARAVGQPDPYQRVKTLINRLIKLYDGMPLGLELPDSNNPFKQSIIGQIPIGQSPIFQGLTNSPASTGSITIGQPVQQQLQQTAMKGQQVFGANDSIFGVG